MKYFFTLIVVSALFFSSCETTETPATYDSSVKSNISVEFDNVVGSSDLSLNTATYKNALDQSFTVTKLKYFVSNFVFTKTDGTVYTVPQDSCYFLMDESDANRHKASMRIPEGEYKTLSFVVGVDSLRNTKDAKDRVGDLDVTGVATDMYWTWNSGYVFFKMDGTSPLITTMGGVFQYHIGGFGGYSSSTSNNLKTITLDLSKAGNPIVKTGKNPNIHLYVDILKAINGGTNMDFSKTAMIHMINADATAVANNYVSMFSHNHTEN